MATEDELYQRLIARKPELAKFDRQELLNRVYARSPKLKGMVSKAPPSTDFSVSTGGTGTIAGIAPSTISPIAQGPDVRGAALKVAGALPAAGAIAGGMLGAAPGAVAGPFTAGASVPAAVSMGIGGAALGGAAGEAVRQLAVRALGGAAPATAGQAAKQIGVSGLTAGASQAGGGLALKAGGKVAAAVGPKVSAYISKTIPERLINSIIKPRLRDFVYGKNPGAGVVDEGIIATSFDDLSQKVSGKLAELGGMYEPIIKKNAAKKIDLSAAIKPIDDAITAASKYKNVNASAIARLNDTRHDIIQNLIAKDATGKWQLNLADAVAMKKEIGEITKFTGNESDDKVVNAALKRVYRLIDNKLDIAVPAMKKLNERWANMKGADQAIKYRAQLMERQNVAHLPELMTGGAVGLGTGMPAIGIGAALAHKALGGTLAKTTAAQALKAAPKVATPISAAARASVPISQIMAMYGITPKE